MGRRRTWALVSLGLVLAGAGLMAWRPEWVLQAEYARQRWQAGAEVQRHEIAGHRWAVLAAGQGPTVVLVHGFTGSKENWLPLMRELAPHYRVIAPDLPGWGDSERQAGGNYGPAAQAERLAAFLRTLPEPPMAVVGHSMGGQISGLVASRYPDLAPRLVLMSSAGVRFEENQFGREVLQGGNPFEVTSRAELHRYLGIVFTDPPFVPWPADRALVQRRRADAAFEQSVLDRIGRGPEAFLLQQELHHIKAPTLLLWCRDDRVIDASAADIFRAGLADSQSVLLAGCGHMPMMAQPREVAEALRTFLK